ncbi:ER degradation-enhancing alpha-mannosidase-like protein 3 isoform X2 [Paramacrobiotus metropolitanus]|uniref:ER degradation-enhancing alpha-mannosidase-like protein 3 isoform X2 n=1 Tax=Paramacrobiotus metropolitanus TaxID=2943436 RepID=UPI0024456BFA|nr:ER degradation-enhancing alpha-mannosidase-like protein 3 isoform X2 [Paramacrobiotus metropolitanus]
MLVPWWARPTACLAVCASLLPLLLLLPPAAPTPGATASSPAMSRRHKAALRQQVKDMFLHAYHAYLTHAYPADELQPLSCRGRFRSHGSGRGDVDDALGNFSMTLVDSLDSLVLLGELGEFERAVRLVIEEVRLDADIVVSVFETNIRMLGGLISAHVLAEELREKRRGMGWYGGQLLEMARQLGYQLLEAFRSTTGMPYPRVNLRHGLKHGLHEQRHTCSACAGTMILEFAALSRLTGDPVFETKSRQAMDYLWHARHSASSLLGHIIDVHSGDWIRRESGIGAGSDSYYEYVLKAYILLGDDTYLHRFHQHYAALLKYVLRGANMLDVHMHQPSATSKPYLDALIAFFPGLQVLYGDIEPAKISYQTLHKVVDRYKFLPEAFTAEPELRIYWSESYLRPEFIESTYFLYTATKDPFYLHVGERLIHSLEEHARVDCGYAALKDTRSGQQDDRMDSFFLAETLKYLYLLFSEDADLPVDLHAYIFTTEAHLLPLHLSRKNVTFHPPQLLDEHPPDASHSCPNQRRDPATLFAQALQGPPTVAVDTSPREDAHPDQCPSGPPSARRQRVRVGEIDWENDEHMMILAEMGISLIRRPDGSLLIAQDASQARSVSQASEGVLLMQDMLHASKQPPPGGAAVPTARVHASSVAGNFSLTLPASPAQFGPALAAHPPGSVVGTLGFAQPADGCFSRDDDDEEVNQTAAVVNGEIGGVRDAIAVVRRGGCMFVEKARNVQAAGARALLVVDNKSGSAYAPGHAFAMSGDQGGGHGDSGTTRQGVDIPCVFLADVEAKQLIAAADTYRDLQVALST